MKLRIRKYVVGILIFSVVPGCDQGLEPEPPPVYGIGGTILFQNWPHPDSVKNLAVVAFRERPLGDLLSELFRQNPPFTLISPPNIPYGKPDTTYVILLHPSPPGIYEYIAVGQRFGPDLLNPNHWRVAGVFYSSGDTTRPGSVFVPANEILRGINIVVDFNNPPPQP